MHSREGGPESAFLIVSGPAFDTSKAACDKTSKIALTDVYPLMCWALGLKQPWPNAGQLKRVAHLFKQPPTAAELAEFEGYARGKTKITDSGTLLGLSPKTVLSGELFKINSY